jgi:hypothetical protein
VMLTDIGADMCQICLWAEFDKRSVISDELSKA